MSNTFKDTPWWVRQRRNPERCEVHCGCPYADQPRIRYVETVTVTAPHWHQELVTTRWLIGEDPYTWYGERNRLVWRYSSTVERCASIEPYTVDVCDLDDHTTGFRRCHYETASRRLNPDGTVGYDKRRRGAYNRADRRNAAAVLRQAASEWNATGATDLQPWHTLDRGGWWDWD